MIYLKKSIIGVGLALVITFPTFAQSTAHRLNQLEQLIQELQSALIETQSEISELKANQEDAASNIEISTEDGIKVKDKKSGTEFSFHGRLMYDYDFYDGLYNNEQDGSEGEWRRTRLSAKGKAKDDWQYGFIVDIDDSDETANINTAYIKYTGFDPADITIGKFKEPFSLEHLTSSKWITAIERNMLIDFLDGNLGAGQPDTGGLMLSGYFKAMSHFNWALGVFDDGSEDEDGEDNYSVTGRLTVAPHFADGHFLHLGLAYSTREIKDRVRYRTRFGAHTADVGRKTFADAYVDDIEQLGLEMAYVRGPFSLQAEYINVSADGGSAGADTIATNTGTSNRVGGACYNDVGNSGMVTPGDTDAKCGDSDFDGYYVQAAYTLTGEVRGYKTKGAYFDKIKPKGQFGAWELVARYEDVKVDNGNVGGVVGNSGAYGAEKLILGVNWYANNNVKFMLNYLDTEADDALHGDNDDGQAVSLRTQYVW